MTSALLVVPHSHSFHIALVQLAPFLAESANLLANRLPKKPRTSRARGPSVVYVPLTGYSSAYTSSAMKMLDACDEETTSSGQRRKDQDWRRPCNAGGLRWQHDGHVNRQPDFVLETRGHTKDPLNLGTLGPDPFRGSPTSSCLDADPS